MISYLKLFRHCSSPAQVCRFARNYSLLNQSGSRVILRNFNNPEFTIKTRTFRLTNFTKNKSVDKSAKVNLRPSDVKRLLSLAKPEKWKIAGKNFQQK